MHLIVPPVSHSQPCNYIPVNREHRASKLSCYCSRHHPTVTHEGASTHLIPWRTIRFLDQNAAYPSERPDPFCLRCLRRARATLTLAPHSNFEAAFQAVQAFCSYGVCITLSWCAGIVVTGPRGPLYFVYIVSPLLRPHTHDSPHLTSDH